jgi:hypothetical protein
MSFIEALKRSVRRFEDITISQEDLTHSLERSCQRGVHDTGYDYLGVTFGARRLDKKITVDELSEITGVNREDIIDLELGGFYLREAVEVAAKLKDGLGIKQKDYNTILILTTKKK